MYQVVVSTVVNSGSLEVCGTGLAWPYVDVLAVLAEYHPTTMDSVSWK